MLNIENSIEKINELLAGLSKVTPSESELRRFREAIKDRNPIHEDKSKGHPPRVGMYSAALSEKIVPVALSHLPEGHEFTGQNIRFESTIPQDAQTSWRITGLDSNTLKLEEMLGKKIARDIKLSFGKRDSEYSSEGLLVYKMPFEVTTADIEDYHRTVGDKPGKEGRISPVHSIGLITGGLYAFLEELNNKTKDQVLGQNRFMRSRFIEDARPGRVEVNIYQKRKPHSANDSFIYQFTGVLRQSEKIIAHSDITAITTGQLDTGAFAERYQ